MISYKVSHLFLTYIFRIHTYKADLLKVQAVAHNTEDLLCKYIAHQPKGTENMYWQRFLAVIYFMNSIC